MDTPSSHGIVFNNTVYARFNAHVALPSHFAECVLAKAQFYRSGIFINGNFDIDDVIFWIRKFN